MIDLELAKIPMYLETDNGGSQSKTQGRWEGCKLSSAYENECLCMNELDMCVNMLLCLNVCNYLH